MCIVRFREDTEWELIYVWSEEDEEALNSEREILRSGIPYEVDIYDTDGEAACLQFPQGEIAIGVPVSAFVVAESCKECDDPANPDEDRIGPLGAGPRLSADGWAVEAELLKLELEKWNHGGA